MLILLALTHTWAHAQAVQVFSEFRRVNSQGAIIPADREGKPREILSPALIRNGFHSVRIVIHPPKNKWYTLHVVQNPTGLTLSVYRELPAAPGSEIPDRLERVKTPVQGLGGRPETFWLDIWTPANAIVRRVRVEAQLHDGEHWYIYPMETRVMVGIVPSLKLIGAVLPGIELSADATARQALREYVCGDRPQVSAKQLTVRDTIRRNAMQDVALARNLQLSWGREKLAERLVEAAGGSDVGAWCEQPPAPSPLGPEWYLRVRDFLYREASR
jgi:hypothetical protein